MALEVQNQQPHSLQQARASGRSANGGYESHDHSSVTSSSTASHRRAIPVTLDLFHFHHPPSHIEEPCLLPSDWHKSLNLKTVEQVRYLEDTTMSRRNGKGPKLDLKLNLSPPRPNRQIGSPTRSVTVLPASPPSSCVSSELNQDETLHYSNSPEATSMMLVGCPRCLMYVMLAEDDPRCPKCKSTVLLDVLHDNTTAAATAKKTKS
ncbi:hypothetical protein F0562_017104 [Nyssa sinensis]|uniref:GIR1-like zinc ribbon domain-containing protein n=1 Tax=Nyssa sinensis TaxID=561372 RepID=A0A5J4ZGD7_9ASTE|nr:hypothetical protein F0562_017104 [Nyssa sinensis]